MPIRTVFNDPVPQSSTFKYSAVLQDETGAPIPATALTTLTLTVYALGTGAIVNGITHLNILNVGRGTVDQLGNLTVLLAPTDNTILAVPPVPEAHVMLLEWTYGGGAKEGIHEVQFTVSNIVNL